VRASAGEGMTGWKGLWKSQQWVIISFAVAFGLLMLYILAVSLMLCFDPGTWDCC
jgi:hypothetical protein